MSILTIAATVATAFNLVCSGTTTESFGPDKDQKHTQFERIYRVDLGALRWCVDVCSVTLPVAKVTPQEIQLEEPAIFSPGDAVVTILNRETGRIVRAMGGKGDAVIDFGDCKKAPFTPFPKPKF